MAVGKDDTCRFIQCNTLRRVVGLLGVGLPIILSVWGFFLLCGIKLMPSISAYYALKTRDVFVGVLFTIGWYLFAYKGYEKKDDWTGHIACVLALGVALFPCCGEKWLNIVHLICAGSLFVVLAYFSIFLFTKSAGEKPYPPRKRARNRIYRVCGIVMLLCIVLIGVFKIWLADTPIADLKPVFWLEALALWAFGISWFTKGETIFRDAKDTEPKAKSS